jgi:uncharacterized protein
VWNMPGLRRDLAGGPGPLSEILDVLDEYGYTSVIATNADQSYARYLRPGELVSTTVRLESVRGPKRTAMGEGYFVTARLGWLVGEEPVGEMLFRLLKFRPSAPSAGPAAAAPAAGAPVSDASAPADQPAPVAEPYPLRPTISQDTAFFWAGLAAGELRIQRCDGCGALRHPPGPFCPRCRHPEQGYVLAAGHGEIYSYVVHHHPPVPGKRAPYVVAVVALPEGVRMIGNVLAEPGQVRIGAAVQIAFERVDEDLVLPSWRLR